MEDEEGKPQEILGIGNDFWIKAEYKNNIVDPAVIMSIAITRQDGVLCYATNNVNAGKAFCGLIQTVQWQSRSEIAICFPELIW